MSKKTFLPQQYGSYICSDVPKIDKYQLPKHNELGLKFAREVCLATNKTFTVTPI